MKKIAIITSGLLPLPAVKDGAIEMLLEYTLDFNELNHQFDFVVYSIDDELARKRSIKYENTKYKYISINKYKNYIYTFLLKILRRFGYRDPNFQYFFIKKVYKDLKKSSYDYVIIESENHFANYLIDKINTPIILYLHNDKLNFKTYKGNKIIEKVFHVFVVSNYLKNQVLTLGNQYNSKISVIHNGINMEELKKIYVSKEYEDTINYLYVGRIEANKGVLELIKSFNNMKNRNTKLFIVGGTFHSSAKKTKYLKKVLIEAQKRKSDIIFTGYVNHNELYKYHSICDVQVVPSIWEEPAGLVNIEAIAAGLKLIVSNVGGIAEYINSETILVEKNDQFILNLTKAMDSYYNKTIKNKNENINYFSKAEYCKRYYEKLNRITERKL